MDECVQAAGGEWRRKCSEVGQPRVKQALEEQVMRAAIGIYRDQTPSRTPGLELGPCGRVHR